jgi:hypothetical protein
MRLRTPDYTVIVNFVNTYYTLSQFNSHKSSENNFVCLPAFYLILRYYWYFNSKFYNNLAVNQLHAHT